MSASLHSRSRPTHPTYSVTSAETGDLWSNALPPRSRWRCSSRALGDGWEHAYLVRTARIPHACEFHRGPVGWSSNQHSSAWSRKAGNGRRRSATNVANSPMRPRSSCSNGANPGIRRAGPAREWVLMPESWSQWSTFRRSVMPSNSSHTSSNTCSKRQGDTISLTESRRRDSGVWRAFDGFESQRAIDIGRQVAREVEESRQTSRAGGGSRP